MLRRLGPGLGAALLAVCLYAPLAGHPFLWDDAVQISENPAVTQGRPVAAYLFDRNTTSTRPDYNTRIYRPLRNLAFRAIAVGFGVRPVAFAVAGLLLYALLVVEVFLLCLALLGDRAAAAWGALLFAAAPVHVEAVAYASAIGDLLSAALEVGALLTFLAVLRTVRRRGAIGFAAASLALAFLAMLAKEMAVTLPLVLAAGVLVGWRLGPPAEVRKQQTALALLAGQVAVTVLYLGLRTHVVERVGQDDITRATLAKGLREAPVLLVEYARLALEPLGHRVAYVVVPPPLALSVGSVAVLLALLWWSRRRAVVLLGLIGFVLSLLPVIHLVPLWADLADRFALVPSIGVTLALAAAYALSAGRWRGIAQIGAVLLLLCYVAGALIEGRAWRSSEALWRTAVLGEPSSRLAHSNLGLILLQAGRPAEALRELDEAHALGWRDAFLELRRATALQQLGRLGEAEVALRESLAADPTLGPTHAVYGDLLVGRGALAEAEVELDQCRKLSPRHPSTQLLAAALAQARGKPDEARAIYVGLAESNPDPRFLYLAARALDQAGERERAAGLARRCLAAEPAQPQCAELLRRLETEQR